MFLLYAIVRLKNKKPWGVVKDKDHLSILVPIGAVGNAIADAIQACVLYEAFSWGGLQIKK